MPRSRTCKFWRRGFLSAYLEGTGEKNAEVRFYKGLGRRPVEKFKSVLFLKTINTNKNVAFHYAYRKRKNC